MYRYVVNVELYIFILLCGYTSRMRIKRIPQIYYICKYIKNMPMCNMLLLFLLLLLRALSVRHRVPLSEHVIACLPPRTRRHTKKAQDDAHKAHHPAHEYLPSEKPTKVYPNRSKMARNYLVWRQLLRVWHLHLR